MDAFGKITSFIIFPIASTSIIIASHTSNECNNCIILLLVEVYINSLHWLLYLYWNLCFKYTARWWVMTLTRWLKTKLINKNHYYNQEFELDYYWTSQLTIDRNVLIKRTSASSCVILNEVTDWRRRESPLTHSSASLLLLYHSY